MSVSVYHSVVEAWNKHTERDIYPVAEKIAGTKKVCWKIYKGHAMNANKFIEYQYPGTYQYIEFEYIPSEDKWVHMLMPFAVRSGKNIVHVIVRTVKEIY